MISRFYLDNSEPRFELTQTKPPDVNAMSYGSIRGWLILILVTAFYLSWVGYHWLYQPQWIARIPATLLESIQLGEMAAALSLGFLWLGLIWQRKIYRRKTFVRGILSREELLELDPDLFELYVANLFRKKGYQVVVRGGSGDHGVDLVLSTDGGKRAIVQCKRYRETVGEKTVRDLFGTLLHERASRAFLVTTAEFSSAAAAWAESKPITLIDGDTLVEIAVALDKR